MSTAAFFLSGLLLLAPQAKITQKNETPPSESAVASPNLSQAEALADLDAFDKRLRQESSYLTLHQTKTFEAIDALKKRLPTKISVADFARELQKILSPIGDCHSSISCDEEDQEAGLFLPFRLAMARGGVVAVTRDNKAFVEPEFPYLVAIDGQPLKIWLDAALKFAPVGSPTQNFYKSVKGIRRLDVLRRDLKIAAKNDIELSFADAQGKIKKTTLSGRDQASSLAEISLGKSRKIGDIGYLRLADMDDKLIPAAKRQMEQFRDTAGLVIDIRGNGGGTYGLMRSLFGYFRPADAAPFVCNIAAYRLAPGLPEDYIEYRPTYRRNWSGWRPQDLSIIDAAMKSFKPSFELPAGQFSDWHFMLLKHEEYQYHYDKPVIILCDEFCISASDGFLAAFAELPKVTLMGVASRGGSGSARKVNLPRSGITFKLSTMASFRPDGKTFDGQGVAVDLPAQPPPQDFISKKNSVLEQALSKLKTAKEK